MDIWALHILYDLHDQVFKTSSQATFCWNFLSADVQRQFCEIDSLNNILLVCTFYVRSITTHCRICLVTWHCYVLLDDSGIFTLAEYYRGLGFHPTFHKCNNIMSTLVTRTVCQPKSIIILNCMLLLSHLWCLICGVNIGLGYTQ